MSPEEQKRVRGTLDAYSATGRGIGPFPVPFEQGLENTVASARHFGGDGASSGGLGLGFGGGAGADPLVVSVLQAILEEARKSNRPGPPAGAPRPPLGPIAPDVDPGQPRRAGG